MVCLVFAVNWIPLSSNLNLKKEKKLNSAPQGTFWDVLVLWKVNVGRTILIVCIMSFSSFRLSYWEYNILKSVISLLCSIHHHYTLSSQSACVISGFAEATYHLVYGLYAYFQEFLASTQANQKGVYSMLCLLIKMLIFSICLKWNYNCVDLFNENSSFGFCVFCTLPW